MIQFCSLAHLYSCSLAQTIAQLCSCSVADRRLYLLLLHRSISISERAGAPHWATPNPIHYCFTSTILFCALFNLELYFGGS